LLVLIACAGPAWAQAPSADSGAGVAALDGFLQNVHTLTADFRQELWTADQRLLETTTGTLALQRPNRFLWRSAEPVELTVVADGEELWTYDVELEQATVAPLDDSAAASPAMLLSGDASVREHFEVARDFALDGLDWVELTPNVDGSDFTSVRIGFKDGAPEQLELIDGLNQVTRIDLTNVVVNPELPESTFEFEPPPGVDVIGGG
jgi:outer membrane lipoprotein carrier protein